MMDICPSGSICEMYFLVMYYMPADGEIHILLLLLYTTVDKQSCLHSETFRRVEYIDSLLI